MGFLAEPQKSLVPIGGGFFATPDTPADPRDCDRFPNSPWCGGGFLDRQALAIRPQIISDKCNLGINFEGTLGFVRLPSLQIVHRSSDPACSPPPPPPPEFHTETDNSCARNACKDRRVISTAWVHSDAIIGALPEFSQFPLDRSFLLRENVDVQEASNYQYVQSKKILDYVWGRNLPIAISNLVITVDDVGSNYNRDSGNEIFPNGWLPNLGNNPVFKIRTVTNGNTTVTNDVFDKNEYGDYVGNIEYKEYYFKVEYRINGVFARSQVGFWFVTRFKKNLCEILPDPPPPKPPKKMDCCPQNEALLKLILKRIGSLPVDVQTSYLTKTAVQPAQLKKIESLTEFIAWFAERFDEVIGEFEVTVEVDDTDLTKQGKQKQTIRLPNLAEAIAEMFTLVMHGNINNELILNIVNRTLIESGQIKQSEFKTFSALNALIDYIGFHTSSKTEKMPLTFKPGELSFDKVLKETEVDVAVLTYDKKETLMATMQTLLQAAAIIRAVHYRRTPGTKEQIASAIEKDLKGLLGESGNLTDQVKTFITNIEKVYDGIDNKTNLSTSGSKSYYARIAPIRPSIILDKPVLAIALNTTVSPGKQWVYAGRLFCFANSSLGEIDIEKPKPLFLGRFNLIISDNLSNNYQLEIKVPKWFISCNLAVYQYEGDNRTIIEKDLDIIKAAVVPSF